MATYKDDLTADWIVGFIDGEGCFSINLSIQSSRVYVRFAITVTQHERAILERVRRFFGVGSVVPRKDGGYNYQVRGKDAALLDRFFMEHPLQTKKQTDYEIWSAAMHHVGNGPLSDMNLAQALDTFRLGMNSRGKLVRRMAVTSLIEVAS